MSTPPVTPAHEPTPFARSIAARIAAIAVAAILVTGLASAVIHHRLAMTEAMRLGERSMLTSARHIGSVLERFGTGEILELFLEHRRAFEASGDASHLTVLGADGQILLSSLALERASSEGFSTFDEPGVVDALLAGGCAEHSEQRVIGKVLHLSVAVPFRAGAGGRADGIVCLARPLDAITEHAMTSVFATLFTLTGLMAGILLLVVFLAVYRRVVGPLRRISEWLPSAAGTLPEDLRAASRRPDEVGVLLRSVSSMLENVRHCRTEQEASLRQVEESRRLWVRTFDSVEELILVHDLEGRTLQANRPLLEKLGLGVRQIEEVRCARFLPCVSDEVLREAREGRVPGLSEERDEVPTLGGIFRFSHSWLLDERGRPCGIVHVGRDVTRRRARDATMTRLASVVQNMLEAAVCTDDEGNIIFVNQSFADLTGFGREELAGQPGELVLAPGSERLFADPASGENASAVWKGELELRHRNGAPLPVAGSVASMLDPAGLYIGRAAVVHPIQEERRVKSQLIEAEKLAAVGQLISGVAHELNNPLTSVIGFSELLTQEPDLPAPIAEDLKRIRAGAERCQHIVKNLLRFARRYEARQEAVNVRDPIQAVIDLLQKQYRVEGIALEAEIPDDLPVTYGDVHRLQQVFLNLVQNAHDAIRESRIGSKIAIRTRVEGLTLSIHICDNGPGIPEELRERIFEPFFTTKEPGKGTGLGLPICAEIAQDHGGKLSLTTGCADCGPGMRTCLKLALPVQQPRPVEAATAAKRPVLASGGRILIIDDEADVLDFVERALRRSGYTVTAASGGAEGLERLSEDRWDLILTDFKMPGVDGRDIYDRTHEVHPELLHRFVVMTGDTVSGEARRWFEERRLPSLAKPFTREELLELTSRVLTEERGL